MSEGEITSAVDLCLPDGRLNPDAVGWSRRPLHRCNLNGPWGRQKRWDYWCVTTATQALSLTYANLDYFGLVVAQLIDFETKTIIERSALRPLGAGLRQPDTVRGADITFESRALSIAILEARTHTQIRARFAGVEAEVSIERPDDEDTLSVVIPWSERRFQYTSKQPALYATATLRGPRRTEENVQAWACLDYGRGLWPYGTTWNWASAAGVQGVHPVGLQFGGKWTDGTGMTENALFVAGKIHKIGDTIDFAYDHRDFLKPWTLRSERVDLAFSPFMQNAVRIPLGVVSLDAHVCFGRFFGRVQMDGGDWLAVTSLLGWAEEFRTRW